VTSLGRIGKYELLKSLALGGMAEIFLARQTGMEGFEKVVVIKKILPHLGTQDRFVQMFLDEARLAARFNHPNIVQIYDLGHEAEAFYIAMEYIHGMDLKSIVRRCAKLKRRIPLEHVVKVFSGVLDGLHYAHTQPDLDGKTGGVVHRDVSPHNVIVSFQGGVKLVDFGIAKARSQISTTIPGRVKGKHAYMSPEQCQGQELDGRSDIFSAGTVMYELVTWTRLFKRKTDLETLKAINAGDIRPPRELVPELDEELQAIIMKALAQNRDQRFQTAQEMQVALEDYLLSRGLKSNSVLISQFLSELFADRLAVMSKALEEAKAENLERAVLSRREEGPDLVAFLDMFFSESAMGRDTTTSGSLTPGSGDMLGPEFTPTGDELADIPMDETVRLPPEKIAPIVGALKRKTPSKPQVTSKPPPSKPPPPRPPAGMEVLHVAPGAKKPRTPPPRAPASRDSAPVRPPEDLMAPAVAAAPPQEQFPPVDPMAGELLPGDPDPYREELVPMKKKSKGFIFLVILVLGGLAGGLIYMFKDTERASTAPATGRVKVKSEPSYADVYFNDTCMPDKTPTEIGNVEPNVEHTLRVLLPGFPPWEQKFTLTDTTKPLEFNAILSKEAALKYRMSGAPIVAFAEGKDSGSIRVTSKPARALIYLDGVSTGKRTPAALKNVPAGLDHVILVEKKGRLPAFERLKLEAGQEAAVNLSLETGQPSMRRYKVGVESDPDGAKVVTEGFPLKKPTPMSVMLRADEPTLLEVVIKGHHTWKRTVRPVPGVDLTIFARLKKK
jgi:serine/threonine protein kinase